MTAIKKIVFFTIVLIIISIPIIVVASGAAGSDPANTVQLTNPLSNQASSISVPELIGRIIKQVLGVVGSLALAMFIYGGLIWMTSAGSSEKVEKGKNILVWAVIGLIIIFTSYALVKFVITTATG